MSNVTIGLITLYETPEIRQGNDGSFTLRGQESTPPLTRDELIARHHNILGLEKSVVPVVFGGKTEYTGYYEIISATSKLFDFAGTIVRADWEINMRYLGTANDVEFESRLTTSGRINNNNQQLTYFWHAPPPNAHSYTMGMNGLTYTDRYIDVAGTGTLMRVYRSISTTINPRWGVLESKFYEGACKVYLNNVLRVGTYAPRTITSWELNSGLMRIKNATSGTASFQLSMWDQNNVTPGWRTADTDVQVEVTVAGTKLTTPDSVTVLRNSPEAATIQLTWTPATLVGLRATLELTILRGARFVMGYAQSYGSSTNMIVKAPPLSGYSGSVTTNYGGLVTDSTDNSGNKLVLGSAQVTTVSSGPTITKSSTSALDFYVGFTYGNPGASGDAANDIIGQYFGAPLEVTRAVRK